MSNWVSCDPRWSGPNWGCPNVLIGFEQDEYKLIDDPFHVPVWAWEKEQVRHFSCKLQPKTALMVPPESWWISTSLVPVPCLTGALGKDGVSLIGTLKVKHLPYQSKETFKHFFHLFKEKNSPWQHISLKNNQ